MCPHPLKRRPHVLRTEAIQFGKQYRCTCITLSDSVYLSTSSYHYHHPPTCRCPWAEINVKRSKQIEIAYGMNVVPPPPQKEVVFVKNPQWINTSSSYIGRVWLGFRKLVMFVQQLEDTPIASSSMLPHFKTTHHSWCMQKSCSVSPKFDWHSHAVP